MLNNVKIFFMILYVSVKLTWTGKVQEMTGKVLHTSYYIIPVLRKIK